MLKRRGILSIRFILALSILLLTLLPCLAHGETVKRDRIYGNDRYETAVKISQKGWNTSQYAVIARGDDFPDALCAGPLAKMYGAPILLTDTYELSPGVLDELKRLGVKDVFIAGGPGAVSNKVMDTLVLNNIKVERLFGSDRYETSVKIAEKLGTSRRIAIATGDDFPDALSISAVAASLEMPILLTGKSSLPLKVKEYIGNRQIEKTYIIGGQGVISDSVLYSVPGGERVYGSNRFETNVDVMNKFLKELKFGDIYLAVADGPNGDEFADALAGSVLAAKTSSPVVLVYKDLPLVTENFIKPKMTIDSKVTALGGEAVVPSSIVDDILKIDETSVFVKALNPPATIKAGETVYVTVETNPKDAVVSGVSSNTGVVSVSVSGTTIAVTGVAQGTAVVTVTASKTGFNDGITSFVISPPIYNAAKDAYYSTIQSAIDNSSPGDTIKIAPGTYSEHLVVNKNNLKLIGGDRDTTIIDASQTGGVTKAGIKVKDVSGIEIKNLTVKNAGVNSTSESSREPYGIFVHSGDKNLFDNIRLQGNGECEIYYYDGCDINTLQNSIIDGEVLGKIGYYSLDGIFSSGGESGRSSMNTGNSFIGNTIKNVVYGISLTACENTKILNNNIKSVDSSFWASSPSAGVVLSNSSFSTVQGNTIGGGQFGIRLSTMSSISPYAYAGAPGSNAIKENIITSTEHGIRVVGTGNSVENNSIGGNAKGDGILLTDTAKNTNITGNILSDNGTGIVVDGLSNEAHFNKIYGGSIGVKNNTTTMFSATKNWWGGVSPNGFVSTNVDYSPWLGIGDDRNLSIPGFQAVSPMTWCTNDSIQEVISLAADGDSIYLADNIYNLYNQFAVEKNLTLIGESREGTVIRIGFDTSDNGDGKGAILVSSGRTFNLSNLTIDGSGRKVMEAVRTSGTGTIKNVEIKNISYGKYNGWGIRTAGYADINVKGSAFSAIEGVAIGVYENAKAAIGGDNATDGNTFSGAGEGDYIQHGIYISKEGGNPQAVILNNTLSNYSGTSTSDVWSSSGIDAVSGSATIDKNTVTCCREAIKLWTGTSINGTVIDDTTAPAVGAQLEGGTTSTGDGVREVSIYSTADNKMIYPVVEGAH